MLWIYDHYKYIHSYSVGIHFRRLVSILWHLKQIKNDYLSALKFHLQTAMKLLSIRVEEK